jgi:hypothetical protein
MMAWIEEIAIAANNQPPHIGGADSVTVKLTFRRGKVARPTSVRERSICVPATPQD